MYINMIELKHLVQKRQSEKKYIGLPFGSAIRFKRKELNLTLEEACEGICSLSYLSKVENNAISVSEEFEEKFKKKFNMKDVYDYDYEQFQIHLDAIINACLHDQQIDQKIVEYYIDRADYQSTIVDLADLVLKKEFDNAEKPYRSVTQLLISMPQEAYMVTMILINHVLYYEMRYSEGLEILNMMERQKPYTNQIRLLINKWKLKHGYKINRVLLVNEMHESYKKELIDMHMFDQVKLIDIDKLMYETMYRTGKGMEKELKPMKSIKHIDKSYLLAKCFYHRNDYRKALEISNKYYLESEQWLALHLLILDQLREVEQLFDVLKHTANQTHPLCKLLAKHLTIKYTGKQEDIIHYIKKEVLVNNLATEDVDILVYLMKDCERLLTKFQYYKDAVYVYRHFVRKIAQNARA